MRLLILCIALLFAQSAFADCLSLPIVGNGVDVIGKDELLLPDDQGGYRPKIPTILTDLYPRAARSYVTIGWSGGPTRSGVITCFRDSVVIPARLGPMTRDQAMQQIHNANPTIHYNPDTLKIPERSSLEDFVDKAWRMAWRYLGPALAWATSSTDDFNRADNSDVGAAWDVYQSQPCRILSQKVTNTTGSVECAEGYNTYVPTANQYVQFSMPDGIDFGDRHLTALVRLQAPSTFSGYVCRAQPPGLTNTSRIRVVSNGSFSTLGNDTTQTWAHGDVLRCEVTGSGTGTQITLKRNGVTVFSQTDSGGNYNSGRGGINVLDDPGDPQVSIDDFEVGDLGGGAVVVRHRPIVIQ